MKKEFYYLSTDEETQIHAIEWIPSGEPKAIVQMCHGMAEYIERYDEFATFLAEQGYYVVGHDHLGHGKSIRSTDQLGFFHETKGNECVVGDIHSLRIMVEEKYPDIPHFMMGHSMGSFLVRQYIGVCGAGLSGAIVMGTGHQPTPLLWAGRLLCRLLAMIYGWNYRSQLIDGMAVGGYEKHFSKEDDGSNWLSKNPENVRLYKNDPLCGYMFTVNAYYHMFGGMMKMNEQESERRTSRNLPILLISGKDDPVGDYGKGVKKVYKKFKEKGMRNVSMRLYAQKRHEILNELEKEQVYKDILDWLEKKC